VFSCCRGSLGCDQRGSDVELQTPRIHHRTKPWLHAASSSCTTEALDTGPDAARPGSHSNAAAGWQWGDTDLVCCDRALVSRLRERSELSHSSKINQLQFVGHRQIRSTYERPVAARGASRGKGRASHAGHMRQTDRRKCLPAMHAAGAKKQSMQSVVEYCRL